MPRSLLARPAVIVLPGILAGLLTAIPASAAPDVPKTFGKLSGLDTFALSNGLQVAVLRSDVAPVVSVQVLDSFGKEKVGQGDMGGIYAAAAPKLNASKAPGEWQKFVIDFQAPRFDGKKKTANALFHKVMLNDVVIHEKVELAKGVTGGASVPARSICRRSSMYCW
jgi:hypothetical protein